MQEWMGSNNRGLAILRLIRAGVGIRAIARDHGLCHGTVSAIKTGKLWSSVTGIIRKPKQLGLFSERKSA